MSNKQLRPKWLSSIKVLVWDLDGTLYREIPEIKNGIHANAIACISRARAVSKSQAEELFEKTYQKLGSSTQTLIHLGVERAYVLSGEWYADVQLKFLKPDKKLVKTLAGLKNFRQFINTNGARSSTVKKLKRLGLKPSTFEKIFTNADMFGVLKPELLPFEKMLKYTGLPASAHLMIGDRDRTDLAPAKKLGMKTCIVWGKSELADISLPSVYQVADLVAPATTSHV